MGTIVLIRSIVDLDLYHFGQRSQPEWKGNKLISNRYDKQFK